MSIRAQSRSQALPGNALSQRLCLVCVLLAFLSPTSLYAQRAYRGMGPDLTSPHGLVNESILDLQQIGTNVVVIDFPLSQISPTASSVAPVGGGTLEQAIARIEPIVDSIQSAGMNVFLRPQVSVVSGERSALIEPAEADSWFASYGTAINGIADFANRKNVSLLGVGYELNALESNAFEDGWRELISGVRSTYSGDLTYAASHTFDFDTDGGYEDLPWWDAVDVVGINAYASVVFSPSAVAEEIQFGWQNLAEDIEDWQSRSGLSQQIVFTEVGYQSADGGATLPRELADPGFRFRIDLAEQADTYQSLIQAMDAQGDWWGGAFFEGWESNPLAGGADTLTYTVQQKPAEEIVADFYGGRPTFSARSSLLASWEDDFESWHLPGPAEPTNNTGSLMLDTETGVTDGGTSLAIPLSGLQASRLWSFNPGGNEHTLLSMAAANPDVYQLELDLTVDLGQALGATTMQFMMEDHRQSPVSVEVPVELPLGDGLATVKVSVPFSEFGELLVDALFYDMAFGSNNTDFWVDNLRLTTTVPGDVTVNGVTDCRDIDAISFFARNGLSNPQYDLNGDGQTDAADRAAWFEQANILPGDLDLNGVVEFADFLVLSNSFGLAGNYCEGDIDGDRTVAFADFLALSTNFGQSSAASLSHVPEPSLECWLVLLPCLLGVRRRANR